LKLVHHFQGTSVLVSSAAYWTPSSGLPYNTLDVAGASTTREEDVAAALPLHGELLTTATPAPTQIIAAIRWCYREDQSW